MVDAMLIIVLITGMAVIVTGTVLLIYLLWIEYYPFIDRRNDDR